MRVAISGGFDPPHIGHIRHFRESLLYLNKDDELLIILTRDAQLVKKKGYVYMTYGERVEELLWIFLGKGAKVKVVENIDKDLTSKESLRWYKPDVFLKGGDTWDLTNLPERVVCQELGIKIILGVGGFDKPRSSSTLKEKDE